MFVCFFKVEKITNNGKIEALKSKMDTISWHTTVYEKV